MILALLPLRADALTDLRRSLPALRGSGPVWVQVEQQLWRREGEGAQATLTQGRASAWVEEGP